MENGDIGRTVIVGVEPAANPARNGCPLAW